MAPWGSPNLPGEVVPPGGSHFGASYQKGAFVSYIGPKGGAKRAEVNETNEHAKNHEAMMASVVKFQVHKELAKPSRLRKAFDHHSANPAKRPGWEARAEELLKASSSTPALGRGGPSSSSIAQGAAAILAGSPPRASGEKEITANMLNAKSYPHACLTRGLLKLSGGRARDWGVDLETAPGYRCPFYDGPANRFEMLNDLPGVEPRVSSKSLRWYSDEEWSNPDHHAAYKITHVQPPKHAYFRPGALDS
jgi:hypothetical protein